MSVEELKALHAEGHIGEVIDCLLEQSAGGRYHNEVVQQANRWSTYKQQKRAATQNADELQITRNRISTAVLSLIDDVHKSKSKRKTGLWVWIGRLALVVGIAGGIIAMLKNLDLLGSSEKIDNGSITVLVHGAAGKDELVLPNRGVVTLLYGDEISPKQISNTGEATFKQIDKAFFEDGARVEFLFKDPEGEPYRLRYPDSVYQLKPGQTVALEVVLEGMEQLEGTVKDFVTGAPLDSVHIRIRGNSFYTNEFGEFTLDIPQDRQAQFIDMRLEKDGYEPKELTNVPTTTSRAQTISLKPI